MYGCTKRNCPFMNPGECKITRGCPYYTSEAIKMSNKAIWEECFDWRTGKIYKRPLCPECEEPIEYSNGCFRCRISDEPVEVDKEMEKYLKKISEVKIKNQDCLLGCHNKKCVETYYRRNPATLEWEVTHGKCRECGWIFIA